MDRRLAASALGFALLIGLAAVWWIRAEPAPVEATETPEPVAVAPVEAPETTPVEPQPDNPWAIRAPEPPERPVDDDGTWDDRRDAAHRAWRMRSVDAVTSLSEDWPASERTAVLEAALAMIDTLGAARQDVTAGGLTVAALRDLGAEARSEADTAFRAAVGDRADQVWAALSEASAP